MLLFPPWNVQKWAQVDDSIRGGHSRSHLESMNWNRDSDHDAGVMFSGLLDSKTLGAAGFASQRYKFSTPLDLSPKIYSGIRVYVVSSDLRDSASNNPRTFTISIATTPYTQRPDGRTAARVQWEGDFELPAVPVSNGQLGGIQSMMIDLPFDFFVPTYRGQPLPRQPQQGGSDPFADHAFLPDTTTFNTETIYEIGIMCRSCFGKQEGRFCLGIVKMEAVGRGWMKSSLVRRARSGILRLIPSSESSADPSPETTR